MVFRLLKAIYENFEQYFCAFLLSILVLCVGLQVFFRYVLHASLTWTEELSRFAFVWTIYVGACLAAKQHQHIRVTVQMRLLPVSVRPYLWMVSDIVWIIFNTLFAIQGVKQVLHMTRYTMISPTLGWSLLWVYAIIPLAFILMSLRIMQSYYRGFKDGTWKEFARVEE